ncbi:DUF523 domain-containing protein [Enterococcus thailandicus]|uniref:DUF523 domain-containing protein n=1 Tax=Enterococcus thailandicus TaxID=417368 RepID=UPI0022EBA81D|nr:DUF523 domain-containing protein [Enterococcus thailandicus]MDA3973147.1 DUF523 domain-containing protein [Enterococcus thailandicus]MDA3975419.1 DUF523 domain-containing protein [Enterococcus thailandicus]MDA3980607.1 DUF523 domain-containing protein [Enterococcus thailandicus]
MIGISACLGGVLCRYDGQSKAVSQLVALVEKHEAIMVCPEILGGLPIPRDPAEIVGGDGFDVWNEKARVRTSKGVDVTEEYQAGAILAWQKLKEQQIDQLILKAKSPSCGSSQIYDGTFSGTLTEGVGVATAYFLQQKMIVLSDEDWLAQQQDITKINEVS